MKKKIIKVIMILSITIGVCFTTNIAHAEESNDPLVYYVTKDDFGNMHVTIINKSDVEIEIAANTMQIDGMDQIHSEIHITSNIVQLEDYIVLNQKDNILIPYEFNNTKGVLEINVDIPEENISLVKNGSMYLD
ncbi:MAG: hypothetical protein ACK5LC_12565 [Coprobacillaceae bacterium]